MDCQDAPFESAIQNERLRRLSREKLDDLRFARDLHLVSLN